MPFTELNFLLLGPWILLFLLTGKKNLPRESGDIRHFAQTKVFPFLKFRYTYPSTKILNTINNDKNAFFYVTSLKWGYPSNTLIHQKAKLSPITELQYVKILFLHKLHVILKKGVRLVRSRFGQNFYQRNIKKTVFFFSQWWNIGLGASGGEGRGGWSTLTVKGQILILYEIWCSVFSVHIKKLHKMCHDQLGFTVSIKSTFTFAKAKGPNRVIMGKPLKWCL